MCQSCVNVKHFLLFIIVLFLVPYSFFSVILYIYSLVFSRCNPHVLSSFMAMCCWLDIDFVLKSSSVSSIMLFSISTSPKKHFFSPPHVWLSLPLTVFKLQDAVLCHRDHARNLLAPESHRLTRKTWLTDLVPFPISSGSRVKLTFPAFRLYLNSEPQRLMAPREILLSPLSICLT